MEISFSLVSVELVVEFLLGMSAGALLEELHLEDASLGPSVHHGHQMEAAGTGSVHGTASTVPP